MPTFSNISLIKQLKELMPQYIKGFIVLNGNGDPIYKVQAINLAEFSAAPKGSISLYNFRVVDDLGGSGICRERQTISFRIGIRSLEKADSKFDLQASYLRSIFAGRGAALNAFSGSFNGTPFTNLKLADFGLFDWSVSDMNEAVDMNSLYYMFGVSCSLEFKNQIYQ